MICSGITGGVAPSSVTFWQLPKSARWVRVAFFGAALPGCSKPVEEFSRFGGGRALWGALAQFSLWLRRSNGKGDQWDTGVRRAKPEAPGECEDRNHPKWGP